MSESRLNTADREFVLGFDFWNSGVNVYSSSCDARIERAREEDYRIPGVDTREIEREGVPSIEVTRADETTLEWDRDSSTLRMGVGERVLDSVDREIAFQSLILTERRRQENGQILSNGCAAVRPDGDGVLILGKRGYGKTGVTMMLCRDYGYRMVASDQVVFGHDGSDGLRLIGGNKYTTLRRTFVEDHFPEYTDKFSEGSFWDDKTTIEGDELPVETARGSFPLETVVFVNIDVTGGSYCRVSDTSDDLEMSLFLSEEFGRYISGICTPVMGPEYSVVSLMPSLDSREARQHRASVIEEIYDTPLEKVESGSFELVCEYIDSVTRH